MDGGLRWLLVVYRSCVGLSVRAGRCTVDFGGGGGGGYGGLRVNTLCGCCITRRVVWVNARTPAGGGQVS